MCEQPTAAEAAALSALNYQPGPPNPAGLRLVYSQSEVDALLYAMAKTRSELDQVLRARNEATAHVGALDQRVCELRELEQSQTLLLNRHINQLAGLV
jgi:hypothetical protein